MLLFTGSTNHTLKSQFFSTFIVFSPCSFVQCLQVDTQIPQWINELSVIPYKNILNNFTRRHEKQTILRQGRPVNLLEYLKRIFLNIWIYWKEKNIFANFNHSFNSHIFFIYSIIWCFEHSVTAIHIEPSMVKNIIVLYIETGFNILWLRTKILNDTNMIKSFYRINEWNR